VSGSGVNAAADDWAYTSCMDLAAGTYILTFKYNTAGGTDYPEKFEVFWGDDNTASAMTDELVPEMEVTNETYETEEVTFEVTTGGIYYIGFHCVSEADMWSLLIDEVSINEYTDVTENVDNKINVFPNPANNVVNIENAENADISILNMLGQEVVSQAATSSRETVNISDLSNGTYIIRIEDGNEVITQKLNVVK
ncbi:MAG: T9SS type A sorting domain-containing protein, partial [Bacteroidota bacterium]